MKPLFKNETKYTEKNYKQFVEFHNNKYNFTYNISTLLISIIIIYCLVLNIKQKNILCVIIMILILGVFLFYRLYLPTLKYKKTTKAYKKEKTIIFAFYNHYFKIGKERFYYFKLFKVFETDEYFYLYVNKENAALVSKNGFKVGSADEFSSFIKKKCLLKYSKES